MSPTVDEAIVSATLALLNERGFAHMSMDAIATSAGVGKPALYRRFSDKAELVASVIDRQLPALDPPDLGDTRAELWHSVETGFPVDGPAYVALIGGLMAESRRHPGLIAAFRRSVLGPRRASVRAVIQRGQARGDIRADIDATAALDLLAGPLLARIFAGADTGMQWREDSFATWWNLVKDRSPT